ncbi:MAG: PEP/pyruvate-binding domain-containing protein, partial [bacterium]
MQPSTGLPALDKILHGIRPGDNIVWQIDSIDDYFPFVGPFCTNARKRGKNLVYFRFAKHKPLISPESGVRIYQLYPDKGFETFITAIHGIIENSGYGTYYVFDSMSELAMDCYSDRMVGNFFTLTCPLLVDFENITFFTVFRNYHTFHAAQPIAETTQIILNIYNYKSKLYIHPIKVYRRYSPTMYTLHMWEEEEFRPVTQSPAITDVLKFAPWPGLQSASYRSIGIWDQRFLHAEEVLENFNRGEIKKEKLDEVFNRLIRLVVSRDERMQQLAEKYLTLTDIIYIWKRMIGCGMIGGKSIGMLLARAILRKTNKRVWELLERHDSFYIGSDVFYTFLVQNGCWWIRQKQKNPETFLDGAREARQRMLRGDFPDYIIRRFSDMLEYFGQSPIIVRSSSLLEDAFGNAFAGKYESVFCANQGTLNQRLEDFIDAVRIVYASAMSVDALTYRARRGVLDLDEQMALLVQRVSGAPYGTRFFPHLAGVGFSFNPYVWHKSIDPEAGMLRVVFGLGTRAVDRSDDDYTRIVALNMPDKRPEANFNEVRRYSQRRVDVIDLDEARFCSKYFIDLLKQSPGLPVGMFASPDREYDRHSPDRKTGNGRSWVITLGKIFSETSFIKDMREMLDSLKKVYNCHVDIEFTANFIDANTYKINLLQCRPLQVKKSSKIAETIPAIKKCNLILEANGGIIGHSRVIDIERLIFVKPSVYGKLPEKERYAVARLIGKLVHAEKNNNIKNIMLIGPGRWGTSTPSLGVPVSFSEINIVSVVCEIDSMHEGLVPDLSLGTHFFNDMVEMNMLYIAFFTSKKQNVFNENLLLKSGNRLASIIPEAAAQAEIVHVMDNFTSGGNPKICLNADSIKQKAV